MDINAQLTKLYKDKKVKVHQFPCKTWYGAMQTCYTCSPNTNNLSHWKYLGVFTISFVELGTIDESPSESQGCLRVFIKNEKGEEFCAEMYGSESFDFVE